MLTAFAAILIFFSVSAQNEAKIPGKLRVFIDCSSTWCDMSFIRTEINLVDFMLDRVAADVHLLVTEQNTGSGGSSYGTEAEGGASSNGGDGVAGSDALGEAGNGGASTEGDNICTDERRLEVLSRSAIYGPAPISPRV